MWKTIVLRFPRTPEGAELAEALGRVSSGPRNAVASLLIHASMAWVAGGEPEEPWVPLRSHEVAKCRVDTDSVLSAPVYGAWLHSQSPLPFPEWLSMATYRGFVRAKNDPRLGAILSPFIGDDHGVARESEPPVTEKPSPQDKPAAQPKITAQKPKAKEKPGSAGVKGLRGMF